MITLVIRALLAALGRLLGQRLVLIAGILVAASLALVETTARAGDGVDTVYLNDGGRVRGSVMVEDDKVVSVELSDGTTKNIPRDEVKRIKYADDARKEPVDTDDADPPRRRHVRNMDSPPEQSPAPPPPAMVMRSPGMVAGGAVLTVIGFIGFIVGTVGVTAVVINDHGGDNSTEFAAFAGAGMAGGGSLGITGAILIGVGRARVPAPTGDPPPEALVLRPLPNGFRLDF